jgi:hypothetical protein
MSSNEREEITMRSPIPIGQSYDRRARRRAVAILALSLVSVAALGQTPQEPPKRPPISPRADRILRAAGQYLADARSFSVKAEIWEDFRYPVGYMLQASRTVTMQVRRPDRLHIELVSPVRNQEFWYDGKNLTLLNRKTRMYGQVSAPKNLDETVDLAVDRYGITLPLLDFAVSDLYKSTIREVKTGLYAGRTMVLGRSCHHLAFTQDDIDWQIWVEETQPVVRKLLINYKNEPGAPQFTVILTDWDLNARLTDYAFDFTPPPGAEKIQVAESVLTDRAAR